MVTLCMIQHVGGYLLRNINIGFNNKFFFLFFNNPFLASEQAALVGESATVTTPGNQSTVPRQNEDGHAYGTHPRTPVRDTVEEQTRASPVHAQAPTVRIFSKLCSSNRCYIESHVAKMHNCISFTLELIE